MEERIKNRLQFVHCDTFFATREEAMQYVNGDTIYINRPALYAEPMILKYGDDEANPNILLAIGSVGDGVTQSTNNRVFFIDVKEIQENIADLTEKVEAWEDTSIESGRYDNITESIVLTLTNGEEVYIEVSDLIEEWGVEETPVSPVVFEKKHVVYEEGATSHEDAQYRDILKADIRLSEKEENILVKDVVNGLESLYVDGSASNISCWIDGEKTNVQEALKTNLVKVSGSEGNILTQRNDGLYANVELHYNELSHTLTFVDGVNEDKVIKLNAATVLRGATYENGKIVLDFDYTDGTTEKMEIPLSEIVKDFEIDNTNHTVRLVRLSDSVDGQWRLSGDVNVSTLSDNILEVTNSELYVKGTADNIKLDSSTTVESAIKQLQSDVVRIDDVNAEQNDSIEVLREDVDNAHDKADALSAEIDAHIEEFKIYVDGNIKEFETVRHEIEESVKASKEYTDGEVAKVSEILEDFTSATEDELELIREEILTSTETSKSYTDTKVKEINDVIDTIVVEQDTIDPLRYALKINSVIKGEVVIPQDSHTAGLGLQMMDSEFSVKLDGDSESYLTVSDEGLAVKGIDEALELKANIDNVNAQIAECKTYADEKVADAVKDLTFTTEGTPTIKLALSKTESSNKLSADVKVDLSDTNIIRVTENGLGAVVNLTYDPITSKLTFNNGIDYHEYSLAANSLVSDAKYDENGNLILVITKEDGTKEEVKVNLEKITGGNDGNSPVTVHVSETVEGIRRITATLSVSNNPNNLIVASDGSLFASKVASDHIGTYRDEEMTMQEALGKIAEEIDNAAQTGGNGGNTSQDVTALQLQVNTLQTELSNEKVARQALEERVLALENALAKLGTTSLIDFGTYGTAVEDDATENENNTEEGGSTENESTPTE